MNDEEWLIKNITNPNQFKHYLKEEEYAVEPECSLEEERVGEDSGDDGD